MKGLCLNCLNLVKFAGSSLSLAIAVFVIGCSSTSEGVRSTSRGELKSANTGSVDAKSSAVEQEAAYIVEVEFKAQSSRLGDHAQKKIDALYKTVSKPELLKSAKIIAWADEESLANKERKLSFSGTELAKKRAESIQSFLKTKNSKLEFELYNMAKRPGTFSEFVESADARIKKSLERAGISTTEERSTPKARRVIVMLLMGEGL